MAYEKQTWAAGDKITAAKLNCLEAGVEQAHAGLDDLRVDVKEIAKRVSSVPDVTFPVTSLYHFTGTHAEPVKTAGNLAALYSLWDALMEKYPDEISVETIGQDASGAYDIRAYTIKSGADRPIRYSSEAAANPVILFVDGIHGNEWNVPYDTLMFVTDLLEHHGTNDVLGMIWDYATIVVIPTCNPWGYENHTRWNSSGVDLNRNFPANWSAQEDTGKGSSGAAPLDQSESKAVAKYIFQNRDSITYVINHHDSETVTEASGGIGYMISNFVSDRKVVSGAWKRAGNQIRAEQAWITEPFSNAKNVLWVQNASINHGTMNEFFNSLCVHGSLLETAVTPGTDFDSFDQAAFSDIHLLVLGNLVQALVLHWQQLVADDTQTNSLTYADSFLLPEITAQPEDYTGAVGATAKFTVQAVGNGLTYQWQYLSVGATTWLNSGQSGNKTATLGISITAARNGQQYRCKITDTNGFVICSDVAKLTVSE